MDYSAGSKDMEEDHSTWVVKFVPLTSTVDSSFWVKYCQEKLDTIQLSEEPLHLTATYSVGAARLQLQETSLGGVSSSSSSRVSNNDRVALPGILQGYNTLENFQAKDKNALLQQFFCDKFILSKQNIYTSFLLLTYADLKHHKVLYWFSMPAMMPKSGCSIRASTQERLCDTILWTLHHRGFLEELDKLRASSSSCPPYFIVENSPDSCRVCDLSLDAYEKLKNKDSAIFGFFDPSPNDPSSSTVKSTMGWPMRNLVAYLSLHLGLGGKTVPIMSYRPRRLRRVFLDEPSVLEEFDENSLVLHVMVPHEEDYEWDEQKTYKAVGWELNARSKPGPRWTNLRPLLDSHHLAVQAADLNLKLMKWRMLPDLQIEKLQGLKVLLIGAGTLGCSVARVLLGWGVRHITFVDNGNVSYSNPVRQSLYTLDDCQDAKTEKAAGGRPKAVAAADALHTIVADVQSNGVVLSIPMPGHPEDRETLESSISKLDALVQDTDAVFLLTDTRESRWLPTVMAALHDKLLVNAALGLDSWLVMRHGASLSENRLGCYFCNDIVAPENSMKNRTLDQQCTVTRPGLSQIASSMAAELMVALLHHPLGHAAPAPKSVRSAFSPTVGASEDEKDTSALGLMPHQIRGSLVSYTMMTPTVPAFSCCTGCSRAVVVAYRADRVGLVYEVCRSVDGAYLEGISGLTAFRAEAADKLVDVDGWDDDAEFDADE